MGNEGWAADTEADGRIIFIAITPKLLRNRTS